MARIRKIKRNPGGRNFYLVDACFLANKYIPVNRVNELSEKETVTRSQEWWKEIDHQIKNKKALVYVPDICIAESFKVLAKKYYASKYFAKPHEYKTARDRLAEFVSIDPKVLKSSSRHIKVHDISTSRDIIIAVDRFYEFFAKKKLQVSVPDLIILATAKYLMDFFNIPKKQLFTVTLDEALRKGTKKLNDVPMAFNPMDPSEFANKVFV